jgi:hypothetical protein
VNFEETAHREALATGEACAVCLGHPFFVHAAQPHHGARPRFMAEPPRLPKETMCLGRKGDECSPVELEADNEVVGIAHDDHVARGLAPSPAFGPQKPSGMPCGSKPDVVQPGRPKLSDCLFFSRLSRLDGAVYHYGATA